MFAMNRCTNLSAGSGQSAIVELRGAHVTVTGNRIDAAVEHETQQPPLRIAAHEALSAVGNIVKNWPEISAGSEVPPDFGLFNNIRP